MTYGNGGDVREIGSDTGGVDNIVQSKLVNERRGLQEEGEGLKQVLAEGHQGYKMKREAEKLTWPIPPEAPRTTEIGLEWTNDKQ